MCTASVWTAWCVDVIAVEWGLVSIEGRDGPLGAEWIAWCSVVLVCLLSSGLLDVLVCLLSRGLLDVLVC